MGERTCRGARDSLQLGLSSLVTNEVVMIIEGKKLSEWIVVSSFVGLLGFGGAEHWLMGRLLPYEGIGHTGGG